MTFLAPIAGIVAAAVTLPVLLLLYFLKLRRRPVRVSSTLLWQRATQDLQVNAPFRLLRASWLLFLQLVVLGLLVMAVARPAIKGPGGTASRFVIVIDRSASMSGTDGQRDAAHANERAVSRLDEAKRRATELVENVERGAGRIAGGGRARGALVVYAKNAAAVTGFTTDMSALREAIGSVAPTDQPGDLGAALRLVDSLGAGEREEENGSERPAIYIYSDGAVANEANLPSVRGVDCRFIRAGPAPVTRGAGAPEGEAPGAKEHPYRPDNLGIVAISARRDEEDPAVARMFVRVQNSGAAPVSATLELRVDGKVVQVKGITVPGGADDGRAGEAAATFEFENRAGGVGVVSIARADLLASDDAGAVVLTPARKANVLLVAPARGTGESPGEGAPDPFLARVLESGVESGLLKGVRTVSGDRYREMTGTNGDGRRQMNGFDLVVFDRVQPESLPPAASISFGAGLPIAGLVMQEGAADQPAEAVHLVSWRRTHPLLRYVSLDQVLVSRTIRMTLPGGEGSGCEAVAWGPDGPVIAVCGQNSGGSGGGVRRIVIGFDLAHTNWGPDLSFPIFINNAVDFLTGGSGGGMGRSFTTAEVVGVKAAAGVKELRVSGPMEFRVRVPEGPGIREGEDTTVALGVLERAGLYRVQGAAPPDDVVPVNLCDAFESRLSTADRINLPGAAIAAGNGEDEGAREVWHWFVGGALVLLTVEWFVFAWKSRL